MKKISMILTAVCLSAMMLAAQAQTSVPATVGGIAGNVQFAPPGSTQFRPVSQETPIPAGSTIRTAGNGQVTLIPFPGVALTLSPNSEMQTSTMNIDAQNNRISKKTALMDLKSGLVSVVIDHAAAKRVPVDFKVKTPSSVAAAVGTKYAVAVINGVTYVKVLEGTINFGSNNGGATTPINSTSGVARLNPDGSVQFVPDSELGGNITTALNSAPLQETTVIAGVPDVVNLTPNTLLPPPGNNGGPGVNPLTGIQGESNNRGSSRNF